MVFKNLMSDLVISKIKKGVSIDEKVFVTSENLRIRSNEKSSRKGLKMSEENLRIKRRRRRRCRRRISSSQLNFQEKTQEHKKEEKDGERERFLHEGITANQCTRIKQKYKEFSLPKFDKITHFEYNEGGKEKRRKGIFPLSNFPTLTLLNF